MQSDLEAFHGDYKFLSMINIQTCFISQLCGTGLLQSRHAFSFLKCTHRNCHGFRSALVMLHKHLACRKMGGGGGVGCAYAILHSKLPPPPPPQPSHSVHKDLGGMPKQLPMNSGYHDIMSTCPLCLAGMVGECFQECFFLVDPLRSLCSFLFLFLFAFRRR